MSSIMKQFNMEECEHVSGELWQMCGDTLTTILCLWYFSINNSIFMNNNTFLRWHFVCIQLESSHKMQSI